MVGVMAALALVSGLFHWGGSSSRHDVQVRFYRGGGWHYTIRHDRFNGKTTCTIYRRDVSLSEGVVTFKFGHDVDTANARFRLGDGSPQDVGAVAVEAAGLGARFNAANLRNPSNGEVHVPADVIGAATKVSIKPNSRMNHRTFDLTGLSRAVEIAKGQNCDDLAGRARLDIPESWRRTPTVANRPHPAV